MGRGGEGGGGVKVTALKCIPSLRVRSSPSSEEDSESRPEGFRFQPSRPPLPSPANVVDQTEPGDVKDTRGEAESVKG